MATEKRQRQDEGRALRRQQQQTMTKKQQRNRSLRGFGIVLGLVAAAALIISLVSGGDGDDDVATDASTTTVAEDALTPITVDYPGPGAKITGDTPCPAADGSEERTTSFEKAPPTCIDGAKTYTAEIVTTEGTIVVELDQSQAPQSVNSFVVLARYHYYDDVPFHRIVPGFVDQAGTPVDQGSPDIDTNPGYTLPDEFPDVSGLASPADAYPDGTFAMAKRADPNSASSQFFIVVNGGGQQFASNPNYSVFGHVTEGLEVATAINEFGDGASGGTPTKDIRIESVTITET